MSIYCKFNKFHGFAKFCSEKIFADKIFVVESCINISKHKHMRSACTAVVNAMVFEFESVVEAITSTKISGTLSLDRPYLESGNGSDPYAVAVVPESAIVGHVPRLMQYLLCAISSYNEVVLLHAM